jgi:hypothetical protein
MVSYGFSRPFIYSLAKGNCLKEAIIIIKYESEKKMIDRKKNWE